MDELSVNAKIRICMQPARIVQLLLPPGTYRYRSFTECIIYKGQYDCSEQPTSIFYGAYVRKLFCCEANGPSHTPVINLILAMTFSFL